MSYSPRFQRLEPWLPEPELWKRFFKIMNRMQTSSCFHEISEFRVISRLIDWSVDFSCFSCHISKCTSKIQYVIYLWCAFAFADSLNHITLRIRDSLFSIIYVSHLSHPLPLSHFLHLWLPRQRPRLARSCHNFYSDTIPQMPCSVIGFLSLLRFLFCSFSGLALSLFSPSLSPALTSGINRAKLIPSFSRIVNASAVM